MFKYFSVSVCRSWGQTDIFRNAIVKSYCLVDAWESVEEKHKKAHLQRFFSCTVPLKTSVVALRYTSSYMTAIAAFAPSFQIFTMIQVCLRQNCPQSIGFICGWSLTLSDMCTAFKVHSKNLSVPLGNKYADVILNQ